jgi:DNA polymerase-4
MPSMSRPDLIFVKPRFDAYKAVSLEIREIFAGHTALIEPLLLDETYLDVTLRHCAAARTGALARTPGPCR